MTERLQELAAIEDAIWRELSEAPDAAHDWHVGVLATSDGERADARSVVLREVDPATRELVVYTDARSPKVAQVATHPEGVLVLWSGRRGWQLRLNVRLSVETAGLSVSSRWARLKLTPAAQDYLSPLPPGSKICRPTPERGTRAFFAVMTARVESADWLELHDDGQRRALFDAGGRHWLAP